MTRHTTAPGPRLWFHLEEVLPIAEHAMACTNWRLIIEPDGGPYVQPALIWESTGGRELLSSNGEPGWYDENGRIHTAAARMAQYTAAGGGGAPAAAAAIRFLPLGLPDSAWGRRPLKKISRCLGGRRFPDTLIARLRQGAARNAHWLAVDPGPGHNAERFWVVDHREGIVPDDAVWEPAYVTSPAVLSGQYPALIAQGYSAHGQGDVIARFDRPTVLRMITCLANVRARTNSDAVPLPGQVASLRFDRDALVVSWSYDDGEREVWGEIDRVHPDRDGFYAVGAYLWPWESVGIHAYSGWGPW